MQLCNTEQEFDQKNRFKNNHDHFRSETLLRTASRLYGHQKYCYFSSPTVHVVRLSLIRSFFCKHINTIVALPDIGDDGKPNCFWNDSGQSIPWPMTTIDWTLGISQVQRAGAHNPLYKKQNILQFARKVLVLRRKAVVKMQWLRWCVWFGHPNGVQTHKFGCLQHLTLQQHPVSIDPKCEAPWFYTVFGFDLQFYFAIYN